MKYIAYSTVHSTYSPYIAYITHTTYTTCTTHILSHATVAEGGRIVPMKIWHALDPVWILGPFHQSRHHHMHLWIYGMVHPSSFTIDFHLPWPSVGIRQGCPVSIPPGIPWGGLGVPKRRGAQPPSLKNGWKLLTKWFWNAFWRKTFQNHIVAHILQTIF